MSRSGELRRHILAALRMGAQSLHHAKDHLGEFFRRITHKLGKPQAVTAMAHKLARIGFHLLNKGGIHRKCLFTSLKKKPFGVRSIGCASKLPNLDFSSSQQRTGDVPWESAVFTNQVHLDVKPAARTGDCCQFDSLRQLQKSKKIAVISGTSSDTCISSP